MPLIPDSAAFQRRFVTLPIASFQAGENVFLAGSRTGRLMILKKGAVAIVKEGVEIARVSEPGAVFGELSILLDQPHTADVLTLESSEFHVASESLLAEDQLASIYLAMVLAKRVNNANRALVELKHQLHAGEPHSVIAETLAEIECNLIYAGYPFNPISRQRTSASFPRRDGSRPTWRSCRSYCGRFEAR
jgi:CRP/FNR family transcriptional regulator, cyclic AMP receptor protein